MREINLGNSEEMMKVKGFLQRDFELGFDENTEYTLVIEEEGDIVATASYSGNIIKQVAIDQRYQGAGYSSLILQKLMDRMIDKNILHIFVYTKPVNKDIFISLGFKAIASIFPHVLLLEWGNESIQKYKDYILKHKKFTGVNIAALVMNCNPFTLGHRYLIKKASQEFSGVYIFLLEEDQSVFPFNHRMELVKEGTKDLENIVVLKGGKYIITNATFPAYFTHKDDLMKVQTELDAEIFGKHIAHILEIDHRIVGTEPYCPVTRQYNESLKKILPRHHIKVIEVDRKEIDNEVISAKKVREALKKEDWKLIEGMVPDSTFRYLKSEMAQSVIQELKYSDSRH